MCDSLVVCGVLAMLAKESELQYAVTGVFGCECRIMFSSPRDVDEDLEATPSHSRATQILCYELKGPGDLGDSAGFPIDDLVLAAQEGSVEQEVALT